VEAIAMHPSTLARRAPLTTFCLLAFGFTWALLPFASRSVVMGLVALCGPAVAALATAALTGPEARRDLFGRIARWRVPAGIYAAALLAPFPISALARGFETLGGAAGPVQFMPVSPLQFVVFVLVVGEEIGWRGYLLPRLLPRTGPWRASATVGLLWALWHLPLFSMPGMPQYGSPFPAFVLYTTALSVLLTILAQRTGGSVAIATLFHGAVNTLGLVNEDATPMLRGWANAAAYGLIAAIAGLLAWSRRPAPKRG
jgi:membrane protease YdiL (CAAX protease family)